MALEIAQATKISRQIGKREIGRLHWVYQPGLHIRWRDFGLRCIAFVFPRRRRYGVGFRLKLSGAFSYLNAAVDWQRIEGLG